MLALKQYTLGCLTSWSKLECLETSAVRRSFCKNLCVRAAAKEFGFVSKVLVASFGMLGSMS